MLCIHTILSCRVLEHDNIKFKVCYFPEYILNSAIPLKILHLLY
jgi:hypothetical protein